MPLSAQQLGGIVAAALPGERLADAQRHADDRYGLRLHGGDTLELHLYADDDGVRAATAALRLLANEIDLPIPQVRAADPTGTLAGAPYLLVSGVGGEPLAGVLPQLGDEQRYDLGRQLGELVARVHRLAVAQYGGLGDDPDRADSEQAYVQVRLEHDLAGCTAAGVLNRQAAQQVRDWFATSFTPVGGGAALVCAGITAETVLLRRRDKSWRVSGLIGWEEACGWSPGWEHVLVQEAFDGPANFGLRVGYGNSYDERVARRNEQVRELALLPYRLLLLLRRLWQAGAGGDADEAGRLRNTLLHLVSG